MRDFVTVRGRNQWLRENFYAALYNNAGVDLTNGTTYIDFGVCPPTSVSQDERLYGSCCAEVVGVGWEWVGGTCNDIVVSQLSIGVLFL